MRLAFCAIIKGSEEEAIVLRRLLENVKSYVDNIFITITYNNDQKECKEVEGVCNEFGVDVSYFKWTNDFSEARNFNFSQANDYDYIMWGDADDVFRGLDGLREVIEKNPADTYSMYYYYHFDERKNPDVVHHKTMVVKNDGCVTWYAPLHEDFKANRELKTFFIKGIERLHLSDNERIERTSRRNVLVSKLALEKNDKDPRNHWNYAQSLTGAGEHKKAIDAFENFLRVSSSDEEKYIAYLRMAGNYWVLNNVPQALNYARLALGIKPNYPDAYHLLGDFYAQTNGLQKAAEYYLQGLNKKPPYYSIIVYNPRDYDYNPMRKLAYVYYAMGRADQALPLLEGCLKIYPKDEELTNLLKYVKKESQKIDKAIKEASKLKKIKDPEKFREAYERLPVEVRSHPVVVLEKNEKLIKTESSGKDLAIMCAYTVEQWTPETAAKTGIGGSEEAVIHLAKRWAKLGWNVEVYNNCGHRELEFDGVKYKPFWSWNYRDKQDVTILWRHPKFTDYNINSTKIFLDLHDVLPAEELNQDRLNKIDKIFVKSKFHRSLFPKVSDDKFVIVPNGIDEKIFEETEKDPNLIINTSSPDRSMSALLDVFEEVKKQVPEARLEWAYGWKVFDSVHGENETIMTWKQKQLEKMERLGVVNHNRLSHSEVAKLYLKANIFLYPTEFAEIHCISAVKAQAGGALPVATDFAALEETIQFGEKVHSEKTKDNWSLPNQFDFALEDKKKKAEMVKKVVEILKKPIEDRSEMIKWAKETYSWDKIAEVWKTHFQS